MGRLPLIPIMNLTSPGRQLGQEVPSQEIPQSFPHVPSLGTPSQALVIWCLKRTWQKAEVRMEGLCTRKQLAYQLTQVQKGPRC